MNSTKVRFSAVIFLLTLIEAVLVLAVLGQGNTEIRGGDGAGYHQLALNLLENFSVSFSRSNPIEPTVYRSPGYPAFLALIYAISSYSIIAVRIAQFALLGLTAYWLYCLALRFVNERTARLSALLCVAYPPLVFLTTFHLTEILATCVTVGLVLLIEKQARTDDRKYLLGFCVGLTSGILALIRPSLSLSLLLILGGAVIVKMMTAKLAGIRVMLVSLTITTAGFAMVLSPWLIRNALLSHRLVLSTANGESLFCSMLQYNGRISYAFTIENWEQVYFPEVRKRGQEVEKQLDSVAFNGSTGWTGIPRSIQRDLLLNDNWRQGAVEEFQKLTATQIIKSIPKRLAYLWSTCDMSPPWLYVGNFHRFVQGHFIILFLLAISGILLRWRNFGKEWLLWIFPLYITLVHLFFHVESRYSMPARPFILIYSAVGFIWLSDSIRQRGKVWSKKTNAVNVQ